jgi:hypothetical protein
MLPSFRIEALELSYQGLLDLCDLLEVIADGLPDADGRLCIGTADALEPLVAATHVLEEEVLFPMLAASNRSELKHTMARLRREHLSDSYTAEEVSEALHSLVAGRPALSPDAIGYLLRSFFEGMRRHVRGELELIRLFPPESDGRTVQ